MGCGGIGTISDADERYRRRREPKKMHFECMGYSQEGRPLSHKHTCSVAQKWRMERGHDDSGGGGTGGKGCRDMPSAAAAAAVSSSSLSGGGSWGWTEIRRRRTSLDGCLCRLRRPPLFLIVLHFTHTFSRTKTNGVAASLSLST